jgi:prepilin-type N-terminal cleavage/methylation domain-containing protein
LKIGCGIGENNHKRSILLKKYPIKKQRGFTLIELLVAMAAFSLLVSLVVAIFLAGLSSQRKITSLQNAQEHGRFIMELMSKEIRMATITNYSSNYLDLINSRSEAITYSFSGNKIYRGASALNPDSVGISGRFFVTGGPTSSGIKITIVMKVSSGSGKELGEVSIQNTITPRISQ